MPEELLKTKGRNVFDLGIVIPLINFVNERHAIYMRKAILIDQAYRCLDAPAMSERGREAWGKGGWTLDRLTDDPILQQYKFCNAFRELDRVTVWIRENIREPFADHPHLWFMLAIARFINWPPTLERLINSTRATWPSHDGFRPENMTKHLEALKATGVKIETGAYMIRAESRPEREWYSWSKQRYVSEIVLGRPWRDRAWIASGLDTKVSLQCTWEVLSGVWAGADNVPTDWISWGPFMSGQVVADLRHTRYLQDAPDVGKWAPVGPGSSRGLNRLAGRPLNRLMKQEDGVAEMLRIQELVNEHSAEWVPPIELHDIQNCLCETDKYLRVKAGEGRPRALYRPNMKETFK